MNGDNINKNHNNPKVLLLGQDYRILLSISRSLGRKNIQIHLGWCPKSSFVCKSKYVSKVHNIPLYSEEDDSWKKKLVSILKSERYTLVIPCDDKAILPVQKNRRELEKIAKFYLLSNKSFRITNNKKETYDIAKCLDIPIPVGRIINSPSKIEEIITEFQFPIVLKPLSSYNLKNLEYKNFVLKAYNPAELKKNLELLFQNNKEILVQENLIGKGIGIEVLAYQGQILFAFQHMRVHEPLRGGASTYRKSMPLYPELFEASKKLMNSLDYTGVGMIEFKFNDSTGQWALLEINGRFWGSLSLALMAEADFPFYLYQLLVKNIKVFKQKYNDNIYCRDFSKDLNWNMINFKADKSDPTLSTIQISSLITEIKNVLLGRERIDSFTLDDPKPGIAEFALFVKSIFLHLHTFIYRPRISKKVMSIPTDADTILFVCKGNICRSPFAQYYAEKIFSKTMKILSCGYYSEINRKCPVEAITAAKEFDINLEKHRSSLINMDLVKNAQIIFVFDEENRQLLLSQYPSAKKKIYLIGLLNKNQPKVISDPYGKNYYQYKTTYQLISEAIDNFKKIINN